jgi:hypothetical protein
MDPKCDYSFLLDNDILLITDLNCGRTEVMHDIENVIEAIKFDLNAVDKNILDYIIICQDTESMFDGIVLNSRGEFSSPYPLGTDDYEEAKTKMRAL